MIDIHIHTRFSFDSEELPENYIERAHELKVPILGFSEHYDYDAYLDGAGIGLCDIPNYITYVEALRKKYGAEASLTKKYPDILCGIEFGYSAKAAERYKMVASSYNFDYIINSVHTLPGRGDSYFPSFFDGITMRQAYMDYFSAVLDSVNADFDYQIIGHIGYVSRYCSGSGSKINYCDYSDILDKILLAIINREKCLEINASSGKAGSDFLPDCDIVKRYLELGGRKLSFGGDAHKAVDYLRKADIAKPALKKLGVTELCYFKNRRTIFYKI